MALQKTGCCGILITRGKKGMFVLQKTGDFSYIPIYGEDEVADVTGAGDTVISTFTLALTAGATMDEAVRCQIGQLCRRDCSHEKRDCSRVLQRTL